MSSTKTNGFHKKKQLPLKGMSSAHSFLWKPFLLVETIPFSFFRKAFVFGGNDCLQLKPMLLAEAILFSGSVMEAAPFDRNFS